ncbi:MAG: calcium-binding protein, partial [Aliidongia sp.]
VTADASGDLILTLDGNDQITLTNALNSGGGVTDGVQQVTFADGTSLSYAQLLALADTASANNTALIGDADANILDSKGLATFEQGNGGGDTFLYNQGYGALTIDETDTAANPDNILAFGAGITAASLTVTADTAGDLILTLNANDQITLTNALDSGGGTIDGVQQVTFANGTSLSYAQLLALADTASTTNTSLIGDTGANILDSKGLATFEQGNGGGDTFIYNQGYGDLTINEADTSATPDNILAFGAGITSSSLTVTADSSGDLILTLGATDKITLQNALNSGDGIEDGNSYGVQQVTFADGTSLSYAQLLALADIGSATNTSLFGDAGANIFDSKGLATFEQGGGGGDSFIYNQGYGALTIDEVDTGVTPDNVLAFGAGIDPSAVTVSTDASGDLILATGNSGDVITLTGAALASADGVQQVSFADGTVWSATELLALADHGTVNIPVGYGTLTLDERALTTPISTVAIDDVSTNWTVTVGGATDADLILSDAGGDSVDLVDALTTNRAAVPQVTFSDGTVLNYTQLLAQADIGSVINTNLIGDAGANFFDSKGFATFEQGGGGGDTFLYNQGYGDLAIDEQDNSSSPQNTLAFGAGITASSLSVSADASGALILTLDTNDQITLLGALDSANGTANGVQKVTFADGSSLSYTQLLALADTGSATNASLFGDAGANIFDSKGKATYEQGGGGGDTFLYNQGYGALTINEADTGASPENILAFGAGITESDLTVTRDAEGDAILSLNADNFVVLDNQLNVGAASYGVQEVTFADGTVLTPFLLDAMANGNVTTVAGSGASITLQKDSQIVAVTGTSDSVVLQGQSDNVSVTGMAATISTTFATAISLTGTGSSATIDSSFGDTISLSGANESLTDSLSIGDEQIFVTGANSNILLNAGDNSSDNDAADTISTSSAASITLTGVSDTASITGNGNRVNVLAADENLTLTGNNEIISLAASSDFLTLGGTGETVNVASTAVATVTGTGGDAIIAGADYVFGGTTTVNVVNGDGGTITIRNVASVSAAPGTITLPGTGQSLSEAANAALIDLTGSSDTLSLTGGSDLVTVSGTGDLLTIAGTAEMVSATTALFIVLTGRGSSAAVVDSGGAITLTGTSEALAVAGLSESVSTVSAAAITVTGTSSAVSVAGNSDAVTVAGEGDSVTLSGLNDSVDIVGQFSFGTVSATSALSVTVNATRGGGTIEGNSDTVTVSGTTNFVSLMGSGDVATITGIADEVDTCFATSVTLADTATSAIVSGVGNIVSASGANEVATLSGQSNVLTVTGQNDSLTFMGIDQTLDIATGLSATVTGFEFFGSNGGDVIIDGSDYFFAQFGGGQTVTLANGTGGTITIEHVASVVPVASAVTISGSGETMTVSNSSTQISLTGSSDIVSVTGSSDSLILTGTADTISTTAALAVTIAGSTSANSVIGTSDAITITGTGDSLSLSGIGNIVTGTAAVTVAGIGSTATINGSGASVSLTGAGEAVSLIGASNAVLVTGMAETINTSVAAMISVTGTGSSATIAGNGGDTIALGGTSDAVSVASSSETVSITGTSDVATITGTAETVSTSTAASLTIAGTSASATITGNSDTVSLTGSSDSLILAGTANIVAVTGSAETVSTGAATTVKLSGAGSSVTLAGNSDTVSVSGAGDAVTLSGTADKVSASAAATVQVTGSSSVVTIAGSSDAVSVTGISDTVKLTGSVNGVTVNGTGETVSASSAAALTIIGTSSSVLVQGKSDAIAITGASDLVTLSGTGDAVTTALAATITLSAASIQTSVTGSNDAITVSGSSDTLTLSGTNDTVTTKAVATVNVTGANGTITIAGKSATVNVTGSGEVVMASGTNNTVNTSLMTNITVTGKTSVVNINGSSDAISATGTADEVGVIGNFNTFSTSVGSDATLVVAGNDNTINYTAGEGQLNIGATGTGSDPGNILKLGAGLSTSDLVVSGDGNFDDLNLTFSNGDSISLGAMLDEEGHYVYAVAL